MGILQITAVVFVGWLAIMWIRLRRIRRTTDRMVGPMKWEDIRRNPTGFLEHAAQMHAQRRTSSFGPENRNLKSQEMEEAVFDLLQGIDDGRSNRLDAENAQLIRQATAAVISTRNLDDVSAENLDRRLWSMKDWAFPPDAAAGFVRVIRSGWPEDHPHAFPRYRSLHRAFASTGAPAAAQFMAEMLSQPPSRVKWFHVDDWAEGFTVAQSNHGISDESRKILLPVIDRLLREDRENAIDNSLGQLRFILDAPGTLELFLSLPYWSADFKGLRRILWTVGTDKSVPVTPEIEKAFMSLADQIRALPPNHPNREQEGMLLLMMVKRKVAGADDRVMRPLEEFAPAAREVVAQAQARLAGVTMDFRNIVWDVMEGHLPSEADDAEGVRTRPIRLLNAALMLGMEVNNGGLEQYFFNSAGDFWPEARDAFHEFALIYPPMQLVAASFDCCLAVFGTSGPSRDRTRRMDQLSEMSRERLKPMEEFTNLYYDSPEETARWLFVNEYAGDFRRAQQWCMLHKGSSGVSCASV